MEARRNSFFLSCRQTASQRDFLRDCRDFARGETPQFTAGPHEGICLAGFETKHHAQQAPPLISEQPSGSLMKLSNDAIKEMTQK
jgi:hypothetical protein